MTVHDAQEKLLDWFLENDTFDPATDHDNILDAKSLTPEVDRAIVEAALINLATGSVITKIEVERLPQWVLMKPMHLHTQVVEISFPLAKAIADNLNAFDKAIGGKGQFVESHNITANSLASLLNVIDQLNEALNKQRR